MSSGGIGGMMLAESGMGGGGGGRRAIECSTLNIHILAHDVPIIEQI